MPTGVCDKKKESEIIRGVVLAFVKQHWSGDIIGV